MTISLFSFPTTIHFGSGASALVADHLRSVGVIRPLVVTDKELATLPVFAQFLSSLHGLAAATFSGVSGNPTASQVHAGVAAYRAHQADSVIGFGGGAALDVCKAIALLATHPGDNILEYAWDHPNVRPIDRDLPYMVALPTTAGTGSEVGRSSVVSDDNTHIKRIIFSPKLLAKMVFADPSLTLGLPPMVTAATGMDALTHNVESYLSPVYHPFCDGIALEGVRIAAKALSQTIREPLDLKARANMMMASMMGAIAFQKDLGAVHSCAHALSTVADLHHGLANALMIDTVMRFNTSAAQEKMAELAHVVNAGENAEAFTRWLARLKTDIGIPTNLREVGIAREQIPALVEIAVRDGCHATNPRPCTAADFTRLFEEAL